MGFLVLPRGRRPRRPGAVDLTGPGQADRLGRRRRSAHRRRPRPGHAAGDQTPVEGRPVATRRRRALRRWHRRATSSATCAYSSSATRSSGPPPPPPSSPAGRIAASRARAPAFRGRELRHCAAVAPVITSGPTSVASTHDATLATPAPLGGRPCPACADEHSGAIWRRTQSPHGAHHRPRQQPRQPGIFSFISSPEPAMHPVHGPDL